MSPRSHASRVAVNEVPNNRAVRKVDAQWRRSHRSADPSHDLVDTNPWPRRTPHRSTRCTATETAADIESIEPTREAIRSGTATSAHSSKPPAAVSSAINAAVAAAVATASASWVRRVTRPSYMCIIMAQATDSCKPRNPNGDNYFRPDGVRCDRPGNECEWPRSSRGKRTSPCPRSTSHQSTSRERY